ncbi:MAG TPA: putative Ig domain-containing protein [Vicinamibacterales bacterium]|nr:putative Ig domain-containing protein [Vicinamibacterales bacterium]
MGALRRAVLGSFVLLLAAGLAGTRARAVAAGAVFGPVSAVRISGAPDVYRWSVPMPAPAPAGYLLCADNGGLRDQYAAVTSANVSVNGKALFRPRDFKKSVAMLSAAVPLLATNELTVEIAGEPGAGMELWIQQGTSCALTSQNRPPVITSTAVTAGIRLLPYSYPVAAGDPDHDWLTFALTTAPPGMTIDPATGAIQWLPVAAGIAPVSVHVDDGRGGVASQDFVVTVTDPPNRPPHFQPIANRRIPRGATFRIALAADDADPEDVLTFSLVSGPAGAAVTPGPLFTWTPQQLGVQPVTVGVHDLAGAADSAIFTLEVVDTLGAPILDPQADATTPAGTPYSRTINALDPNPGDLLTFALVSGPAGLAVSPAGGLTWTPALAQLGPHAVKVQVTDSTGLSDATVFTLNVTVPALAVQPPVAVDDQCAVRKKTTLTVSPSGVLANDTNPSGGALAAQIVTPPTRGQLSLLANGGFSYTPAMPPPGSTAPALKYAVMSSTVVPGNLTPSSNRSHTVVADLDRDGQPEIIFESMAQFAVRRLVAVNGHTGTIKWMIDAYQPGASPKIVLSMGGAGEDGSLSVSDLDGDGTLEILAVHSDDETSMLRRKIIAFNHDGSYRWTSDDILDGVDVVQTAGMFQIDEADLDGDGKPEIVVHHNGRTSQTPSGISTEDLVTVFGNDGHVRWTRRVPGLPSQETLTIADIDLDGRPDIVIGTAALDRDGNVEWNTKSTNPGILDAAVANLDSDPFAEIVYVDRFGQLYCYEHTGAKKWGPVSTPGTWSFGMVTIADTDGDGVPEILQPRALAGSVIDVRDANGNLVRTMSLPGSLNTLPQGGFVTVFDLNGDGAPEVIYQTFNGSFDTANSHGSLFIFDGPTGALLHEFHASRSSAGDAGAIVADVDGDGSAEIVMGGWNDGTLLNVLTAATGAWTQTRPVWNQQVYHVTNIETDGRVPARELVNWLTPGLNNFRVNVPLPAERTGDVDLFTYVASSGALSSNTATVRLDILPPNTAPRILSTAPVSAAPGIEYLYGIRAVDPDIGEVLTYSLVSGPAGMTIGAATGLVRWTPPSGSSGPVMAVIRVTDSQSQSVPQQFTIVVGPPAVVPDILGMTTANAQAALAGAGLVLGSASASPSPAPTGSIISQDPAAGVLVASSGSVNVIVSSGPAPVPVPYVIGSTELAAQMALSASTFGVTVTRAFSNTVADGLVISQSPAAGTPLVPGTVTITVSVGSGLDLRLSRATTTADASIPFTVTAYDLNYVPSAPAGLSFSVVPAILPAFGALPVAGGNSVVPALSSRGAYRIVATDALGHSSAVDFAVTYPSTPGQRVMSDVLGEFSAALEDIDGLAAQARNAYLADDTPAMRSLLDQMVQRWRQVDVPELKLTTPFGLPVGFFPTSAQIPALGLVPTSDDLAAQQVLKDALADIQAWIDGQREPTTSIAQLNLLAGTFHARFARFGTLTLSEWGAIKGQPAMTVLLTDKIPALYDALMNDLEQVVIHGAPDPLDEERRHGPSADAPSTLAEQVVKIAVQVVIAEIKDALLKPVKQVLANAAWSAAVVAGAQHYKASGQGQDLTAVVAGASLSFHEFHSPWSFIEGDFDLEQPEDNVVILVGPKVMDAVIGAAGIKNSLSTAQKADQLYAGLKSLYQNIKNAGSGAVVDAFQATFKGAQGCIFTTAPACGQLMYDEGFVSVYDYESGTLALPVPILFVIYNKNGGTTFVDTPVFMPYVKPPKK